MTDSEKPALNENAESAVVSTGITEDLALSRLATRDVSAREIEDLAMNRELLRSRKLQLAIARHIHTPRSIALPLIRQLFIFELMEVALTPALAADVKLLAEECIVRKLASTTLGERLTLAKRGSGKVAAALLTDGDIRVREAALNNPRMTEMFVVRALMQPGVSPAVVEGIKRSAKWSVRVEVRRALEKPPT